MIDNFEDEDEFLDPLLSSINIRKKKTTTCFLCSEEVTLPEGERYCKICRPKTKKQHDVESYRINFTGGD